MANFRTFSNKRTNKHITLGLPGLLRRQIFTETNPNLVMVEVPAGLGLGVADGAAGGAVVSAGLAGEQLEPRPLPDHQLQLPRGLEVKVRNHGEGPY